MTNKSFTLTHPDINGGDPVRVLAPSISIAGKKNVTAKPDANGNEIVKVQDQSYENLKFSLQNVKIPSNDDGVDHSLDYDDLITLYTTKYDDTKVALLQITYGNKDNSASVDLTGSEGLTFIYVVMDTFNATIDTSNTVDGYVPSATITFVETKA